MRESRSIFEKAAMKANICLMLLSAILALPACTISAHPYQPGKASICSEPGTIGRDKIPHPTQGFNIAFEYYLPPCYDKSGTSRFPVIYLIAVPFERRLDATENTPMSLADRLIRAGKMPATILVVPDATVALGYPSALAIDLVPYVDGKFNTLPERAYRGVGGISHGAAIAARMAFQFPQVFGSLGLLSGGIASEEERVFDDWISAAPPGTLPRLRIDVGGQDSGILPLTQNLVDVLQQRNVIYTLNIEPGDHNWNFWSPRMESYLLWFAQAWK
jgi:enterochelin esterase-like enzyme